MAYNRTVLLVINQLVPKDIIRAAINTNDRNIILSTHMHFPEEKSDLKELCPKLKIYTFDDFLCEESMSFCDEVALKKTKTSARFNFDNYMSHVVFQKNLIVANAIIEKHNPDEILICNSGLGIAAKAWKGSSPLTGKASLKNTVFQITNHLPKLLSTKKILLIQKSNYKLTLISDAQRLKLHDHNQITTKKYQLWRYKLMVILGKFKNHNLSATMHGFEAWMLNYKRTFIFTDGFFPSNYPESYINIYGEKAIFFTDSFVNSEWFLKHNKCIYYNEILKPAYMQKAALINNNDIHVLVAFNHAGDWSGLINRSDTDKLLSSVVRASKELGNIKFFLRFHPTMSHPQHEGKSSLKRLKSYVKKLNLDNLLVSENPIEKDLLSCDLILSEYSNVLIDGMHAGKIGLILNATKRRNFMIDFENLGFHYCESDGELVNFLTLLEKDPLNIVKQHNKAIEKYNEQQKLFIEEKAFNNQTLNTNNENYR